MPQTNVLDSGSRSAAATAGASANAAKYTSLSPDATWNPQFAAALLDMDAAGMHVKNLDYGPGFLSASGLTGKERVIMTAAGFLRVGERVEVATPKAP